MHSLTRTQCNDHSKNLRACTIACIIYEPAEVIDYEQQCHFCQRAAREYSTSLNYGSCTNGGTLTAAAVVTRVLTMADSLYHHERMRESDIERAKR